MQRYIRSVFIIVLFFIAMPSQAGAQPLVAGWSEHVLVSSPLGNSSFLVDAKLDSGARTSSLHAEDIVVDEEQQIVRFTFVSEEGERIPLTCPYIRTVRIKRRPEGYHRRPVVGIRFQLGKKVLETEVNLTDRSNFNYRLLIGRRDLEKGILVDSSRKNILPLPVGTD